MTVFDIVLGRKLHLNATSGGLRLVSSVDFSKVKSTQWKILFTVLAMPDISELVINGPRQIFVTRRGKRLPINKVINNPVGWTDMTDFHRCDGDLENNMEFYGDGLSGAYCLFEGGLRLRTIDPATHKVDGHIRARCHVVLPPITEDFPLITIAKQSTSLTTLDAIQHSGSLNREMMEFVRVLVKTRKTIVLSGGSGAGKTTFLSAMTRDINPEERIIVCEDAPELQLPLDNVAYMQSYPAKPGLDPNKQATLSYCVKQVQRMRPDRVIIGETRGPEFADFIVAANSGYDGSLTTIHADNPKSALDKMAGFCKRAPGAGMTPMRSINKDICEAVDYIIQLKYQDGKYRTTAIEEMSIVSDQEDAAIKTNPIWGYDPKSDQFIFKNYPEKRDMLNALRKIRGLDEVEDSPYGNRYRY